jgi:hypothetical protein
MVRLITVVVINIVYHLYNELFTRKVNGMRDMYMTVYRSIYVPG